jgi:signal peptidase II
MKKKIIIYSSILFIIDLISKLLIDNLLSFGDNIYIIKNFLVIKKVYNTGASFSILLGKSYLFIICGIICIYYLYKSLNSINNNKLIIISYSLLFSGIIGNMVDRILYKHVIDFISILSFPIFNIADIFICSGSILLLIYYMKEGNV